MIGKNDQKSENGIEMSCKRTYGKRTKIYACNDQMYDQRLFRIKEVTKSLNILHILKG